MAEKPDSDAASDSYSQDVSRTYWCGEIAVDQVLARLSAGPLTGEDFHLLAEHLPTLCWLADADGSVFWYNRRWYEYTGTTPQQMLGWGWRSVHDPKLLEEVEGRWREAVSDGTPFEVVFSLRGADGVFRPFLTRIVPVRDATGEVARWCGVNTEVSDLAAAQKVGREVASSLRRVLDGMGEGFALLDHQFRILDLNAEAIRLDRRPREAMIGLTHWEVYPGTENSEIGRLYRRAMAERVPVMLEHRYDWDDGHHAWLEMRAYPVEEGLAVFYRDITERYEAQHEIRRESERVALALDAGAIIGTWDWDLVHDSFMVDERFADSFGLDPHFGREGLSLEQVIATVHPEDRSGLITAIDEVRERGGRYAHQYRVRRADGRYYWIEANGRVDMDDDGRAVRFPGVLLDVEARRAVEQERDQALTLLRTFTEAVPGVVYAKDMHGRMLVANQGTAELIGKHPDDFIGKTDAEFLDDPAQAEAVMANDRRIMEMGQVEQVEEEVSLPDGRQLTWLSTKGPLRNEKGEIVGLVGASIDVTERKRAEDTLRETTRRLDAVLANTREAVFLMNDRQQCIYANPAAEKLTGYSFAELATGPLHDVIHCKKPDGSHYPLEECPIDRAFPERAQMSGEELFVARDGSFYPVAFTASPVLDDDGEPVGTVIEARNIEAEKAAGQALSEAEERLRLAVENAEVGLWDVDLVNDVLIWPARTKAMFGISPDVPVTMQDFYDGLHSDDRAATAQAFADAIDPQRRALYDVEYRTVGKEDGVIRWIAAKGRGVFDRGGADARCLRVLGTALDVTARKRAETALHAMNEELERRVSDAIAEREQAEEALRQAQKMEAVGQLTGGIAHDFNNLLTVVTGNIDMATRALDAAGVADPRSKRALDSAMKGAERAAALTQRLLAFSRRQPLAPKPVDADRLVAGMSDLLNRSLGEMVKLEIVTSPGLWRVEADPNQLESAILNLAVNARDAMPRGGTLTIETANARLDEEYSAAHAEVAPGHYVVIAVTDTGQGMSRDTLARVFEPFFTTKEVGKGTGLGLSQVYGFTKQSGGHIKIYSEEAQGTTVKIYLPRLMSDESGDTASASVSAGIEASARRETILAVEDDDDVRAYTVESLRELGYRVLEAHDGPSAIRLLERRSEDIDLLFTDVVMPGMSGRELADVVRERQPNVKVLYTSGYTKNAIVHAGRLDEGVEMIAKPFTFQALAAKVRDVLEAGRTRRVLLVEDEPTVRLFTVEALGYAGYLADEAATAAEALMKVRAAQGRYDAVVLDAALPDKRGDALAVELRALYADLPILIATGEHAAELSDRFAGERCVRILPKPYGTAKLAQALRELGLQCLAGCGAID
ncbi:hybrid sensor histidine kinase/response regulator [Sphingomonas beigongshangi]|uniref:hybrid sensor histidine kinase/response regulator n=1 Tax=Sphingomonas beigongshangi TaxID=2782540 RepID=UPI001FEF74E5|nr:PAS domain-containing protein [Sphingomonas beigongshangi]